MIKKRYWRIGAVFLGTLIVFLAINPKVQEGRSVECPKVEIFTDSIAQIGNLSNLKRGEIYLNGVWQFSPALGDAKQPPEEGWGAMRVPGDWRRENHPSIPGLVSRGKGIAWQNFNGNELSKAWYQQKVIIPKDWSNRRIFIDLKRVSTDAVIFVNGIQCGAVNWPYGAVDISQIAKPGDEVLLNILVTAAKDENQTTVVMGPNEIYKTDAKLVSRGLIGEVRLLSLPKNAYISDVFVHPSTRKKQIILETEIAEAKAGPVEVIAKMFNQKGELEKEFKSTTILQGIPNEKIIATWNWENPRLWDVGKPNLYTLKLQIKGAEIDDEYDQTFGFREFWIEDKKFYLNGTEIRLRPALFEETWAGGNPFVADKLIDSYMWAGFNIAELWPWNHRERGRWHFRELLADCADKKGFALMGPALSMVDLAYGKSWNQPAVQNKWEAQMLAEMRRYRNHPSILLWATNANFFGFSDDSNPRRIGKKQVEGSVSPEQDKRIRELFPIGENATAKIKKHDPTRPVMVHQGGPVGDIFALNFYLNLIPLQEREEWLSDWVKTGNMPFMTVEFGTPLHTTMMRGRNGFSNTILSEPLMTEFSAIYLGNQAYALETQAYRAKIREFFIKDQEYKSWHFNPELDFAPAFQQIQKLFSTQTWRSWRTFGITGGMVPWNDGHGWQVSEEGKQKETLPPFKPGDRGVYLPLVAKQFMSKYQMAAHTIHPGGIAILENNGPTLAWIGGSTANFTEKSHHFYPGNLLEKQAILLNDTREKQTFNLQWQVTVDGQNIATGQQQGTINSAQNLFIPIKAELPKNITAEKVNGEISLTASIGNRNHQDRFTFRILDSNKNQPAQESLQIFDPVGKTSQMLQKMGYKITQWDGKDTANVLILGRESLQQNQQLPGKIEGFIKTGGRVIIFTQKPEILEKNLGFRTAPHQSRRVFPIDNNHPLVKGLDAEDLRDWNGASTLLEAYPNTLNGNTRFNPHNSPYYGWHWGNTGTVSSVPVEKPHHSGWRPILESEFDLAYTPLMELNYGKGKVILTTLDLEDYYAKDPVASKITKQLINYAQTAKTNPQANNIIFIGSNNDAAKLDALGVNYTRAESIPREAGLVIIGTEKNVRNQYLEEYLNNGGKIFFMPRQFPLDALGIRLEEVKDFIGSLNVPNWPEFQGISMSDLRARSFYNTRLIKAGGEIGAEGLFSRFTKGKGVAIFSQMNPQDLQADANTYLRYTRWRQTRTNSQILANLGAGFQGDQAMLKNLDGSGKPPTYYHQDYRTDFDLGDDPYRYYRW